MLCQANRLRHGDLDFLKQYFGFLDITYNERKENGVEYLWGCFVVVRRFFFFWFACFYWMVERHVFSSEMSLIDLKTRQKRSGADSKKSIVNLVAGRWGGRTGRRVHVYHTQRFNLTVMTGVWPYYHQTKRIGSTPPHFTTKNTRTWTHTIFPCTFC